MGDGYFMQDSAETKTGPLLSKRDLEVERVLLVALMANVH